MVGAYGVGMTVRTPRFPVAGETVLGGPYSAGPGGKGSNQAIGAARLGAQVELLTAVGGDGYGTDALRLWGQEGVGADCVRVVPGAATMVGVILVEETGENCIVVAPGALADLTVTDVEAFRPQLVAAHVALVSLEIPLDTALAALRVAHEEGATTILNPAPAQRIPDEAWQYVDLVTPNRTEAPVLLGEEPTTDRTPQQLAAHLRERTGATVVLTLGADGVLVDDGTGFTVVPPFPVDRVTDTTGAGDAFNAALAVALDEGQAVADAARFAAAAGAHAVTVAEVIPALPRRSELETIWGAAT